MKMKNENDEVVEQAKSLVYTSIDDMESSLALMGSLDDLVIFQVALVMCEGTRQKTKCKKLEAKIKRTKKELGIRW